jgi:thiamine biosynthesis lipoprotein ApbE
MKKIFSLGLIIFSILMLSGCQSEKMYTFNFYDYMDTYIRVQMMAPSESDANKYHDDIDAIFSMYHDLSTSYEALDEESIYLENIYSLNQNIGQRLEVDQELYDLLVFAEEIKEMTDGYFDISIGKAVDVWKDVMDAQTEGFEVGDHVYVYHYYDGEKSEENKVIVNQTGIVESVLRDEEDESVILSVTLNVGESTITIDRNDAYKKEISKTIYDQAILDIDALDFSENSIILEEEQSKYHVTFSGEDIKVDLGAISKGYATQKVYEYIKALEIKNFSISSGTSSIVLGENQNRAEENFVFYVSLANPYQTEILDKDTYGTIKVKNMSVTTSGNYEQYVLYQGQRYHHIVSPLKKMPVQYYHTVTILGEDAGLLDALSTALFSMPPEEMSAWLTEYQETLDIEVIRFNQDLTVDTFLLDTEFEEH